MCLSLVGTVLLYVKHTLFYLMFFNFVLSLQVKFMLEAEIGFPCSDIDGYGFSSMCTYKLLFELSSENALFFLINP